MLMFTEQKLLFSWWPAGATHKNFVSSKRGGSLKAPPCCHVSSDLVCGCPAPSCRAAHCSSPEWCGPRDSACCCWTPHAWTLAALAAPAAAASTWQADKRTYLNLPPWKLETKRVKRKTDIKPFRVGQINISPKFNDLSDCFLLRTEEWNQSQS